MWRPSREAVRRLVVGGVVAAGICISGAHAQAQSSNPNASAASTHRAVVNKYYVTCHNDRLRTAGLTLDKPDLADIGSEAALWEKVLSKLRTAAMPAPGAPRPDPSSYAALTSYVETELDRAAASKLQPGRVSVHRLNRWEYINAIKLGATRYDPGASKGN